MSKTLGGSIFIHNGEKFDYCYKEAVACLKEFCDKVSIVEVGSSDGTAEIVRQFADEKTSVMNLPYEMWEQTKYLKKEQLSHFSNIAHNALDTDWFFYLQGDEILNEKSYDAVRKAIETNNTGFLVTRHNLWKDCNHVLNVPVERRPCSSACIRLAPKGVQSWDDAEQLYTQSVDDYLNDIVIVHYGFVRKKEVMPNKIRHMLGEVFQMGIDEKLNGMEIFDSSKWFTDEDLLPFNDHPAIMREWIKTRP